MTDRTAMSAFVTRIPVRFGDIDQAGIVYYPSLLHILHVAFEELFPARAGSSYAALLNDRAVGFPTVHMECDFLAPLRYGETMSIALTVATVGRTSATFDHLVTVDGPEDIRARARLKRVAVDMHSLRPVPVPADLRSCFAQLA